MKVAYFTNQYPGISHSFIRREIQALERQDIDVTRFAIRPSKDAIIADEDLAEQKKTRYITLSSPIALTKDILVQAISTPNAILKAFVKAFQFGWKSDAGLFRHCLYFFEAIVLSRWLLVEKITHLHAHFGTNATTIALLAAQIAKVPFSFTAHGPEEFEKIELISLAEKAQSASFVVAISQYGASQLKKITDPQHWPRIKIIRCGIEKSFLADSDAHIVSEPHFVATGRLCREKGQLDLVEAVAIAVKQYPNLKVTLIGDGPMRAHIEHCIKKNNLEENVFLAGWKTPKQVRELLTKARAFVLPSYAEGLPVSIMEALAVKKPVISTYIAGIPELIEHDSCGWLIPAGDVNAIAEALRQAITADDKKVTSMGEDGYIRVRKNHDIDQEAEKLIAHFKDLPLASA